MGLTKVQDNQPATAEEDNGNWAFCLRAAGQNTIQQFQDRAITLTADGGIFAEAFIDSDGRNNTVDTGTDTTAKYIADKLAYAAGVTDEAGGDITHDPDSYTSPSNAFDNDDTTAATKSYGGSANVSSQLGKTFSSKYVESVYINIKITKTLSTATDVDVESYDGATWNNVGTFNIAHNTQEGYYFTVDDTVEGIRISVVTGGTGGDQVDTISIYSIEYGTPEARQISLDIPTGTFSSTISTAFATVDFSNYAFETGMDFDFKLKNAGGDDSGWLTGNEISSFTAFVSEPDELLVRINPKTSSPIKIPLIKGVALLANRPN